MARIKIEIVREGYKCERCGHEWLPKENKPTKLPISCPSCKSPYWNKPRKGIIEKDELMKETKTTNNVINNSVQEYVKFTENLLKEGFVFEKTVSKFSKTSAAIYLPKRLIGRKFKVFLMPLDVD